MTNAGDSLENVTLEIERFYLSRQGPAMGIGMNDLHRWLDALRALRLRQERAWEKVDGPLVLLRDVIHAMGKPGSIDLEACGALLGEAYDRLRAAREEARGG